MDVYYASYVDAVNTTDERQKKLSASYFFKVGIANMDASSPSNRSSRDSLPPSSEVRVQSLRRRERC